MSVLLAETPVIPVYRPGLYRVDPQQRRRRRFTPGAVLRRDSTTTMAISLVERCSLFIIQSGERGFQYSTVTSQTK